ncbi:MAG: hypothetical protein PHR61_01415 [Candidatus Absconditabacteria bacterium]|nr:hypothetical protein [Candidatus Absconditabacteria bacterium]
MIDVLKKIESSFIDRKYPYNFFIFGDGFYYYSSHGKISSTLTYHYSNEILNTNRIDRGKLLDAFSKIEFLLGYIIFAKVNNYENIDFFDRTFYIEWKDIIDSLNFHKRIKFIESWKLIKDPEIKKKFSKIYLLKDVRNQVAHLVNINEIIYSNVLLKTQLDELKEDINEIWNILLEIYNSIRNQKEFIDYLITKLSDKKYVSK